MGGKNKYMLNGSNIQHKRVQDMFCSVQLNVNNPHFLIMQGRITKVLNMKPVEVSTQKTNLIFHVIHLKYLDFIDDRRSSWNKDV